MGQLLAEWPNPKLGRVAGEKPGHLFEVGVSRCFQPIVVRNFGLFSDAPSGLVPFRIGERCGSMIAAMLQVFCVSGKSAGDRAQRKKWKRRMVAC